MTYPTTPPTLRERKRAAAMRAIQVAATDLFEDKGFTATTIEEIADAADVSPSTVYRYFGTKEGIVIHDEFDDPTFDLISSLVTEHDPWEAVQIALDQIAPAHFTEMSDLTRRRTVLCFAEPSIRSACYVALNEFTTYLARAIAASPHPPRRSPVEASAIAASLIYGLWQAVDEWYQQGMTDDLASVIDSALAAISPAR